MLFATALALLGIAGVVSIVVESDSPFERNRGALIATVRSRPPCSSSRWRPRVQAVRQARADRAALTSALLILTLFFELAV